MEIEDTIKAHNLDIDNHFLVVRNQASRNKEAITRIFGKVRDLINKREAELKDKISSVLDEEESYLNEKKTQLNSQLKVIDEFKRESRIIDSNIDIKVLQHSQELYNLSQRALEKHSTATLKDPFVNVKEDIEIMQICKMINPSLNTTNITKSMKNSKYSSGGYRPQGSRTKSKDGRSENLKSTTLLKKGNWNNSGNIAKKSKISDPVSQKQKEEPNYTKAIHNKKRGKQNPIDEMDNAPSSGKNTQVSQGSSEACLRSSVEAYKKKQVGRKGPHDWKKNDEKVMQESKTPFTTGTRGPYPPFKKSTSLNEARNKYKSDRAKGEKMRKTDSGQEVSNAPKVPRLGPTKSTPVYHSPSESLPSYRKEEVKGTNENFEIPSNWEVSRIEQNSELEKSFKKEMRGILPMEEKSQGYEIERRLEDYEEHSKDFTQSQGRKKVSASPASEDKAMTSMVTSQKDVTKHDLSRMMITVDQFIYVISGYKNTTLSSVERLNLNKGIWQPVSDINIARTKFGSVSVKGQKIYLLGGKLVDGSRTDIIEEYDVSKDQWVESKLTMPSPRSGFSNVLLSDKQLIIIGGNDGQVLET